MGLLLPLLAGCGDYTSDLDELCNAAQRAGASSPALDPAQKARLESEWLGKKLHSKEGKALFAKLAASGDGVDPVILRSEAAKQRITSCPYADELAARAATAKPPRALH